MSGEEHSRQREEHRKDFEAEGCGVCLRNSKEAGVAGAGRLRAILVGDGPRECAGPPRPSRGLSCWVGVKGKQSS